jgi:hypothetical protein
VIKVVLKKSKETHLPAGVIFVVTKGKIVVHGQEKYLNTEKAK